MRTRAHSETPMETYGQQTRRGSIGEREAMKKLIEDGYIVTTSETSPHGAIDIIARKGGRTRRIQVKRISSRVFATRESARNRIRIKPYLIEEIPKGLEVWVYDGANHLYIFRK